MYKHRTTGRPSSHARLTTSLSALPAANSKVFAEGIWISAPVPGFRPTTGGTCARRKRAEPDQSHGFALRERGDDGADQRIQRLAVSALGEARRRGDDTDQILLILVLAAEMVKCSRHPARSKGPFNRSTPGRKVRMFSSAGTACVTARGNGFRRCA